jgi:hypothetical protein
MVSRAIRCAKGVHTADTGRAVEAISFARMIFGSPDSAIPER